MTQKEHFPVATGIKFIRKANMWLFYKTFNAEHVPDIHEFFATEEEAKARLAKEQNG
jgi:hypothetical protein